MKERECLNVLIANLRSQLLNQDKNIRESMQPMITESCKLEDKVARLQKIVDAFIRGDFDLDE